MFTFEKLETWHKAIDFAAVVYSVTKGFPGDERFGLTSQKRRAAVSILSNISESNSRFSKNHFARFLEIATGSVFEVLSQSFIAKKLYVAAEEQGRMLSGLRNAQLNAR
jgi:four helix bundle protein